MEYKKLGSAGVESFEAKARRSVVEFSLLRCREFVSSYHHVDVDVDTDHVWEHQWDQFLTDFYLICHENSKIQVLLNQKDLIKKFAQFPPKISESVNAMFFFRFPDL